MFLFLLQALRRSSPDQKPPTQTTAQFSASQTESHAVEPPAAICSNGRQTGTDPTPVLRDTKNPKRKAPSPNPFLVLRGAPKEFHQKHFRNRGRFVPKCRPTTLPRFLLGTLVPLFMIAVMKRIAAAGDDERFGFGASLSTKTQEITTCLPECI